MIFIWPSMQNKLDKYNFFADDEGLECLVCLAADLHR